MASSIRIDNAFIVTMNAERDCFSGLSVLIKDDRISDVAPKDSLESHQVEKVIDGAGMALLPGLIDAHAHAGHSLVKSLGGADNNVWYEACEKAYMTGSDVEFWRADAALHSLERLKAGVTTGVTLLGGGNALMRVDTPDYASGHIEAILANGARELLAVGPTLPPHPRIYRQWPDGVDIPISFEQQLKVATGIFDDWHEAHNGRVNIAFLYPTIRPEHLGAGRSDLVEAMISQTKQTHAAARERNALFTQDGHERGTVAYAHRHLGTLGPQSLFSHAVELEANEIDLIAATDTRIAHNPSAIASIFGRCPATELRKAGVTVALGSDGTAPDRSSDMLHHAVRFLHYHRRHFRDPSVLHAGEALDMITIDAAKALGLEKEIGSIEIGKKADLILIDLRKPHLYPPNMPLCHIIYFANGADVDTVIVDGKVVMAARKVLTVDESKVLANAAAATQLMLDRTGMVDIAASETGFWPNSISSHAGERILQ
jgi:cytosine/adenosine deaminase-related metal-dependent hydrolase